MSDNIIFVGGRSDTGKTASLRNLKDPEGVLYLNFESKKPPFASKFKEQKVTDPYTLQEVTQKLIDGGKGTEKFHTLIVDSITACMALYTTKYIGKDCPNKMAAWGDYGSFYEKWAKQQLPQLKQNVIVLAHIDEYEEKGTLKTYVQAVVQGKLKNIGLEADFGVVVNTAIVSTEVLKEFNNPLLTITEEEEIDGYKHVIQTRKTNETKDTKIRSGMGMWSREETYIDSDVQLVLDRINQYYSKEK
jgi:hypothetical protein